MSRVAGSEARRNTAKGGGDSPETSLVLQPGVSQPSAAGIPATAGEYGDGVPPQVTGTCRGRGRLGVPAVSGLQQNARTVIRAVKARGHVVHPQTQATTPSQRRYMRRGQHTTCRRGRHGVMAQRRRTARHAPIIVRRRSRTSHNKMLNSRLQASGQLHDVEQGLCCPGDATARRSRRRNSATGRQMAMARREMCW